MPHAAVLPPCFAPQSTCQAQHPAAAQIKMGHLSQNGRVNSLIGYERRTKRLPHLNERQKSFQSQQGKSMINSVAPRLAGYLTGASNPTSASASRRAGNVAFSVAEAQAESAKAEQAKAAIEAKNAEGIKHLGQKGLTMSHRSYTSVYKDNLAKAVDSNDDQTISKSELANQVLRGGGSKSAAAALYAAMDMNGDGGVSAEEFKNSIPDPFGQSGFKDQLDQLIASGSADPRSVGALFRRQAESLDAATVLGELAKHISTSA